MKLAVPWGLLGLISIALLILIYILKPKYQDKKVASTYIWKLSLKYAKRKVPFQWLQSSVIFIIELLILSLIALTMSFPQVVLASKSGEKIVILDASASMTAEYNGKTRFDRAKSEISSMIDETTVSHKISIILADEKPSFVIRRSDSASYAKQKLFEAECSLSEPDISGAMELAEDILAENPNSAVYLFTDCDYADSGKVEVVNVASSEWNAAILDFTAKREKGRIVFTAEISSYGKAAEIAVSLKIDGKAQMPRLADCKEDETVKVVWDDLDISSYERAEIHISADDSFSYDNDFCLYSDTNESFNVQLVAQDTDLGFLLSAFRSTEKCRITTVRYTSEEESGGSTATEKSSGFDLYVYDNYVPDVLPKDGAVWFINPPSPLPVSLGLTVSGTRKSDFTLSSSGSNSETAEAVLKTITPSRVRVTEYTRITSYAGYESILQINSDPVLLVRNENGLKTVVIPFDIHNSDLPIVPTFSLFINALCDYSMAHTMEKTLYEVGETVRLNAKADAESISVKAEGVEGEGEIYTSFPVEIKAEEAGAYTFTQETNSGRTLNGSFYVRVARNESVFGKTETALVNPVTPYGNGTDASVANNTMSITVYLLGALMLLVCVEWGVQYREQY